MAFFVWIDHHCSLHRVADAPDFMVGPKSKAFFVLLQQEQRQKRRDVYYPLLVVTRDSGRTAKTFNIKDKVKIERYLFVVVSDG